MPKQKINATILGRKTTSRLNRLTVQVARFQDQVNRLLTNLRNNGIKVTAVHNHWLFKKPRLMYVHWESIDKPLDFARKVKRSIAFWVSMEIQK